MRPFLQGVLLSVVFTCAVGQAQRLCQPANQNPTMYYPKGGLNWYVTELQPSRPMQVSALQFILRNYSPATMPIPFAVWASDPAGKPGTVLAKKTIQLPAGPHIAWHGARFDQPVSLASGKRYFIGLGTTRQARMGSSRTGTLTRFWRLKWNANVWTGPHTNRGSWVYRIYCGQHKGAFTGYGVSKPGTGGLAPELAGLGWPNTANPIGFVITGAKSGVLGSLIWGPRFAGPIKWGKLYVFPAIVTLPFRTNAPGTGTAFKEFRLKVPDNPTLAGAKIALQAWVLDPGAQFSVAHTAGLEMLIGK